MYTVDTIELRKRMIEKGFTTIDSLSDASGVNRVTIGDVVNGRSFPSSIVMSKIGTALDMAGPEMGAIFFKLDLHEMQDSRRESSEVAT